MDEEIYMQDKSLVFTFDYEALGECPLCANNVMIPNGTINWMESDFWYVMCSDCGLKYMNPRPTRDSYREFYKNYFWQQKVKNLGYKKEGQMFNYKKYKWDNDKKWSSDEGRKNRLEKQREQRPKTIIPVIKKYVNLNENASVLEVGCGFGVTLDDINKQYGSNTFGVEPSDEARKTIEGHGTVELIGRYAEELEDIARTDKKFDAIIFSHSLENTVDPFFVIENAKKCLKKGGIVYIQTPNLLVFDQMNPYHPYIFCDNSLKHFAKKVDMQYERVSELIDRMLVCVFMED
jgi:2-polyprenyl-3-methyl-5-hydroxy-6-metoxy-1,4-benzoquinol methylase